MERKIKKAADGKYLRMAIEQARASVKKGGFPAGALVVKNGKIIARGISLGIKVNDPTGHAESCAIRKACKILKTINLNGATLYGSLQPCLMCFSAASWAGITRMVFGCKKSRAMISKGYYEGKTDIYKVNRQNNKQIKLVYRPDFERDSRHTVDCWEKRSK